MAASVAWHCRIDHRQIHRLPRRPLADLYDADRAGVAQAMPRQTEHERIELLARERLRRSTSAARPDEAALMQAPRRQPDADAIMDEDLQAGRTLVSEDVRMMGPPRRRPSRPERGWCRCRHACPSARCTATPPPRESSKPVAKPGRALSGGTGWPDESDGRAAAPQLDADVSLDGRRWQCQRHERRAGHGYVLRRQRGLGLWRQLALRVDHPLAQHVRVQAMRQCHRRHRHTRAHALLDHRCLELRPVPTPTTPAHQIHSTSVHLSAKLKRTRASYNVDSASTCVRCPLTYNLNANVVHRWRADDRRVAAPKTADDPKLPTPAFIALDVRPEAEMPARDIRIELKRGRASAVVHWPVESASSCAAWLREWRR